MKKLIILVLTILLILVGCSNATGGDASHSQLSGKTMRVHFINIGQGDSILIESPNGKSILIDGGKKGAGETVVSYIEEQGIETLEYVVATHPDADHIGGLISVLQSIPIKNFIDSGKIHTSNTYEEMLSFIQTKNIPYIVPQTGDQIQLDDELQIDVISADEHASDNNEASIVLKVTYGDISFLLTGDAGIEMEEQMIKTQDVRATILKAGHHGSNTSSSFEFIKTVKPEVTILSYGQDNSYGHPYDEVIENLQQVKSKIYSTAESGDIVVETDGIQYEVFAQQWTGIGASNQMNEKTVAKETIVIDSKDLEREIVSIKNNGKSAVNMKGWKLVSVDGNQVFNFPNITIQSGTSIYITSGTDAKDGNSYIKWTGRQIWLNSGDMAQLINPKGELVSELK